MAKNLTAQFTSHALQEKWPVTTSTIATKKKKKWGNIYTIAYVGFFLYIYNSNLNILPKFKIVARITLLHLNVLL